MKAKLMQHDQLAFKAGDKVAVIHKLADCQSANDWDNHWVEAMDQYLFQTYTVADCNPAGVYFEELYEGEYSFGYPSCCCILVADVKMVKKAENKPVRKVTQEIDKTTFTDYELQLLQKLLQVELNTAGQWLREAKQVVKNLWDKCNPELKHHSDVAFAYKTMNSIKKDAAKLKKYSAIFASIQNKIKWQLGNKSLMKE